MRELNVIAAEIIDIINSNPKRPNYTTWSMPYLKALLSCEKITDRFGFGSARGLVLYALGNLQAWKGEDAKRLKAELKEHLK
jgi:hypothetical protein